MKKLNTKITHKRGVYTPSIVSKLKDGQVFYDVTGEHGIWMGNEDGDGIIQVRQIAGVGVGDALWEKGDGNGSIVQKTIKGEQVEVPCIARGVGAIAIGTDTSANSDYSFAEGMSSMTLDTETYPGWMDGVAAHAEGNKTTAGGRASHAEGDNTVANNIGEHAEGRYNISHFSSTKWGDSENTIHSIGIGSESPDLLFENSKNAFEVMQNGDVYVIGVGNYEGKDIKNGSNKIQTLQDTINSINSGLITVVQDVDLIYDTEKSLFTATIPNSDILNDFKSSPYRYNLIVEVHGQHKEDGGSLYGYTANHFCYSVKAQDRFAALCQDKIEDTVTNNISIYSTTDNWGVRYTGWLSETGGQALPEKGSKVSIYLQRL